MDESYNHIQVGAAGEIQRIISPVTWKYLKEGYFFTRLFPFHPFEWDETTRAPKVITGFCRLFLWHIHLLAAIVFFGALIYRSAQVTVLNPGRVVEQMYVLFLTAFYSVFMVLQIHVAFKRHEMANWVQGVFLLTTKCEGNSVAFQENARLRAFL